ncbi:MAG: tetratricopeptide repeat protein [Candidatus Thiodiazotropha sp.]
MRKTPDLRLPITALVIMMTLGLVALVRYETIEPVTQGEFTGATQQGREEYSLDGLFSNAVGLLHTGHFEAAAGAFGKLVELAPWMPEAEVNLAYALMGLGQYGMAQRHFNRALELNEHQLNAYYGLAIAMEQQGDMDSALGAMRVYVHLAKAGDPYLRKAWAAIWEWENIRTIEEEVIE